MMKPYYLLCAAALFAMPSCERQQSSEIKNKVDDALDRRPNEKIKDAAEDTKDAVEDAAKDVKDAVKDATR